MHVYGVYARVCRDIKRNEPKKGKEFFLAVTLYVTYTYTLVVRERDMTWFEAASDTITCLSAIACATVRSCICSFKMILSHFTWKLYLASASWSRWLYGEMHVIYYIVSVWCTHTSLCTTRCLPCNVGAVGREIYIIYV